LEQIDVTKRSFNVSFGVIGEMGIKMYEEKNTTAKLNNTHC
jgi:hypothetical protein